MDNENMVTKFKSSLVVLRVPVARIMSQGEMSVISSLKMVLND